MFLLYALILSGLNAKTSLSVIAKSWASKEAVRQKIRHLGSEVVDRSKKIRCSTTTAEIVLPNEFQSNRSCSW
jgi:hypothetical protein